MATIMNMHWPEVSKEQYEQARAMVNWEGETPAGAKLHVSWFADDGFHVLDVWDSEQDFQTFVQNRLGPAIAQIGVQGQPKVTFSPMHAIFAPDV